METPPQVSGSPKVPENKESNESKFGQEILTIECRRGKEASHLKEMLSNLSQQNKKMLSFSIMLGKATDGFGFYISEVCVLSEKVQGSEKE